MKRIEVRLGDRGYPVVVGDGALGFAPEVLRMAGLEAPPIVVTNSTVWKLHGGSLLSALGAGMEPAGIIRIGDGERYKNSATLHRIYEGLFRVQADRRSWVLAFGGGVVGDIAGFAAATFMRGIPYASLPTTLLAQVDSAIGGKVGINLPQGKNLIGSFHQPRAVISDIGVLRTLPARELASGLFEAVKCGAIRSEKFLAYLERRLPEILERHPGPLCHVVAESVRIKAEVVASDERESGQRAILNYGHTVGHALEAATRYRRFKHGEAVAWGMIAAVAFGRELGMLEAGAARRLASLIRRVAPIPGLPGFSVQTVWRALLKDKKFRAGDIRMVMLPELGRAEVVGSIEAARLRAFLSRFLARAGETGL